MTCSICGRKLKNPRSQKLGYGPICYRRFLGGSFKNGQRSDRLPMPNENTGNYDIPGQISMEEYLQESGKQ